MKHSLFFVSFLISFTCYSQKYVEIRGIAKDTTKNRSFVQVAINDTLFKYLKTASNVKDFDHFENFVKNKNLVVNAGKTGVFTLQAKLTDSISFYSSRYYKQTYSVPDLLKMNPIEIKLVPIPCIPYNRCEEKKPTNYYVFIGEKIDVKSEAQPYYCNILSMDNRYRANYKILENINGNYPQDKISFLAFDHYGTPQFSKYKNVMLFVIEACGKLVHRKYQFFDVYKAKNGKWATPGDPYKYDEFYKNKTVKAEKIEFDPNVFFDISGLTKTERNKIYPKKYYKIKGKKAIPIKGAYSENLLEIKKIDFR